MKLSSMAKVLDPQEELTRTNMTLFREEANLSQAEASELSGVPLDNLRRYENGTTSTIPFPVIAALAKVYGHAMEDFAMKDPPPAKLDEQPVFFLRTRPGVKVDPKLVQDLQRHIDEANKTAHKKRGK